MAFNSNVAVVLAVSFVLSAVIIGDAAAPSPSPSQKSSISLPPKAAASPKSSIAKPPTSSIAASPKAASPKAAAAAAPGPSKFSIASSTIDDTDDELDEFTSPPKKQVSVAEEQEITRYLIATTTVAAAKIDKFISDDITKRIEIARDTDNVRKCLTLCKEVYSDASVDINKVLQDVRAHNWAMATVDTSRFANDVETCTDCFGEIEVVDIQIEEIGEWASGVANETLKKLRAF